MVTITNVTVYHRLFERRYEFFTSGRSTQPLSLDIQRPRPKATDSIPAVTSASGTDIKTLHSLFCCCTASMEQAADGAETAAIDGLVSSRSENIPV